MSGYPVKSTLYTSIVQYPLLILTKLWRVDKKATERWRFYPELHSRPTMRGLFVLLSLAAGAQAKNNELFGAGGGRGGQRNQVIFFRLSGYVSLLWI